MINEVSVTPLLRGTCEYGPDYGLRYLRWRSKIQDFGGQLTTLRMLKKLDFQFI